MALPLRVVLQPTPQMPPPLKLSLRVALPPLVLLLLRAVPMQVARLLLLPRCRCFRSLHAHRPID